MIRFQKYITRANLRANPNDFYVFGDNLARCGFGGQAREMRGEPNAIGIVTKKYPAMRDDCFFTDDEYEDNRLAIDLDVNTVQAFLREGRTVVFPAAGIGTGLSEVRERAPRTFRYLSHRLTTLIAMYHEKE